MECEDSSLCICCFTDPAESIPCPDCPPPISHTSTLYSSPPTTQMFICCCMLHCMLARGMTLIYMHIYSPWNMHIICLYFAMSYFNMTNIAVLTVSDQSVIFLRIWQLWWLETSQNRAIWFPVSWNINKGWSRPQN